MTSRYSRLLSSAPVPCCMMERSMMARSSDCILRVEEYKSYEIARRFAATLATYCTDLFRAVIQKIEHAPSRIASAEMVPALPINFVLSFIRDVMSSPLFLLYCFVVPYCLKLNVTAATNFKGLPSSD